MSTVVGQLPSEYLRTVDAAAAAGFSALRVAVREAGPIDEVTRELVLLAAFATAGNEIGVRAHALRALELGLPAEALRHAVLLTLGATTTLIETTRALQWVGEACAAWPGGAHD